MNIEERIASELSLPLSSVQTVVTLLNEGNTVPFIARYRKEKTGSMDDQSIRRLSELLERYTALEKRRGEILRSLQEQEALTDDLARAVAAAETVTALEDLYRPYRQKRKTRASVAAEKGLAPLAEALLHADRRASAPESLAKEFISPDKGVETAADALQGARDIIAETMSNDAEVRSRIRLLWNHTGLIRSEACPPTDSEADSADSPAETAEPVSAIPDHRILALNRGEKEGRLRVKISMDEETALTVLRRRFIRSGNPCADHLETAAADSWRRLIAPSLEREIRNALTERASASAIEVFGSNLRQLLMQPPVKGHVTLGVDPGFRTGCKLAVVDAGGKVLDTGVAQFTLPGMEQKHAQARSILKNMILRHGVTAIAIGNGTASRESERFIAELLKELPGDIRYAIVSEAGASVYSASELGAKEFPDYDVSLRSAVSIARRLQDPLAELVKIDPKSIGVGQYQHDLKPSELSKSLDGVVESCVNAVGVELSTASAALLTHVAGIGPALAENIVAYRDEHGIQSRAQLKKVPKLGPRAFEQCAGFLRIADSRNALDATGVHPETYAAAEALIGRLGYSVRDLRGGAPAELAAKAEEYGLDRLSSELGIGIPTLKDVIGELIKPGRDPRDELPQTVLRSDVVDFSDLKPGMQLHGTVRNVTDFGAFVDIGVHQDGLVHISKMSTRFIRHPSEAAKVGDVVTVWVLDVDEKRKRISLSMIDS